MFIKTSAFKRLLNQSYSSGGFTVRHSEIYGLIIIESPWWGMAVAESDMTNKFKGMLIEFIGDIPEGGECWRYRKKEHPQSEIPVTGEWWIDPSQERHLDYVIGNIVLKRPRTDMYLVQNMHELSDKRLLPADFIACIDRYAVEVNEDEPDGPYRFMTNKYLYWKNKQMTMRSLTDRAGYQGEEMLLRAISNEDAAWTFTCEDTIR